MLRKGGLRGSAWQVDVAASPGCTDRLAAHLRTARRGGHVIVCWPTYGLLEPLLWLASWRRSTVSVIVHDPTPLRPQIGWAGEPEQWEA